MAISIEEAVQRLKAEIIAPDWRLSGKRIDLLEEAFGCLQKRFTTRKGVHATLVMATNTLAYIRKKGDQSPPDSVDFLKEAMAHVVNIYEDPELDLQQEDRIFKAVYARFQALKRKIQISRPVSRPRAAGPPPAQPLASQPTGPEPPRGQAPSEAVVSSPNQQFPAEVQRLVQELKISLERAEEIGTALRSLLDEAQAGADRLPAPATGMDDFAAVIDAARRQEAVAEPEGAPEGRKRPRQHELKNCPATPLLALKIGEAVIGVRMEQVALARALPPDLRRRYLASSRVGLADFHRLFRSLAKQFKGPLATIPNRKLRQLSLPIMTPQGVGLPELPDEEATTLLLLSVGNWHGGIFCTVEDMETKVMVKFRKAPNGDLAGVGYLQEGGTLPLLNVPELLRREGFLAVV